MKRDQQIKTVSSQGIENIHEKIMNLFPQSYGLISADYKYIYANRAYSLFYKVPVEKITGRSITEFIDHEAFEGYVKPAVDRCIKGENVDYDLKLVDCDGVVHWLHFKYAPFRDDKNNIIAVASNGLDSTRRIKAEAELVRFKKMTDKAKHGSVILDLNGVIVYTNEYFADLHGFSPEELKGRSIRACHNEKQMPSVLAAKKQILEDGAFDSLEIWHTRRDGTEFPMLVSGITIYDGNAVPEFMAVTAMDLTEKRSTEKWLEYQEIRYRSLFNTVMDSVIQFTGEGIVTEVNESACSTLGLSREELIGCPLSVFDINYDPISFSEFWSDVPDEKQMVFNSNHKTKSGRIFPVEICAKKYREGDSCYIFSIARDITQRNHDREQLLEAVRRAEESDKLKSAFLANMSHEIRTPLNGILGFTALLNDPELDLKKRSLYCEVIRKSGNRLLSTINAIIDIARIESGLVDVCITEIDPDELMDELYNFFCCDIEERDLKIKVRRPDDFRGKTISSDGEKLHAILRNLLENAIKFTPEGTVEYGYEQTETGTRFFVKDTGIGISSGKLDLIYDRFVQVDSSLSKGYQGSGLGLAISMEYAKMIGGEISVETEEGKGTAFYLDIPH